MRVQEIRKLHLAAEEKLANAQHLLLEEQTSKLAPVQPVTSAQWQALMASAQVLPAHVASAHLEVLR